MGPPKCSCVLMSGTLLCTFCVGVLSAALSQPLLDQATPTLVQLIKDCPEEWQQYMSECYGDIDVLTAKGCPHMDYACFLHGAEGQLCRVHCPVGNTLALFNIVKELFRNSAAIYEVRSIVIALDLVRWLLPDGCRGVQGQAQCHPLLPVAWFDNVADSMTHMMDKIADADTRPLTYDAVQQATGRSIVVVTAYYTPSSRISEGRWSESSTQGNSAPFPWYLENKRCYAKKHGYAFYFEQRPPSLDMNQHVDGYKYSIMWLKNVAIREALTHHDWVFWIDYDALFTNLSQTIDEFIKIAEQNAPVDLIVQHGRDMLPTNAFLMRSTSWSFRFLDKWEEFGREVMHGRSFTWDMRCFNCAVAHFLLASQNGLSFRTCYDTSSHVFVLSHILERSGVGYDVRQNKKAIGKVYFWEPGSHSPRGFLFNPNHGPNQKYFPESELYHAGDLAVHWPMPDKGTPVMRQVANELLGRDDCEKWSEPRMAHAEIYKPLASAGTPSLYMPEHVMQLASHNMQAGSALVVGLETKQEELIIQALLRQGHWTRIDVLTGHQPNGKKWASLQSEVVRVRPLLYISQLPITVRYDFMYINTFFSQYSNATSETELDRLVEEATPRLVIHGLVAFPLNICRNPKQEHGQFIDYLPIHFQETRAFEPEWPGNKCRWAYYIKPILPDEMHQLWKVRQ